MTVLSTSFRNKKIIKSILIIYMWTFGITATCTLPDLSTLRELFTRLRVDFAEPDGIVRITYHITVFFLKIKRRINTLLFQPYRFAPRTFWFLGCNKKITAMTNIGSNHVIDLKSATKPLNVLIAFTRPLITEFADNLNLKHPLLPTISPYPTM